MELREVSIDRFKEKIYSGYKKIFPEVERKSYRDLKNGNERGIVKLIEIIENDKSVGFMILNTLKGNKHIGLDYFAIWPENRSKGYGTKAIKLVKEKYKEYNGLFIEIEKLGCGKDEEENKTRERRAKFYQEIGFQKLNFDLFLFGMEYSIYVLPFKDKLEEDEEIRKDMFEIYIANLGEKRISKNCRVIEGEKEDV